jgi:hypothetical protein
MDLPSRGAAAITALSSIALGVVTVTGPTVPDESWGARGALVNALGIVVFVSMAVAAELLVPLLSLSRVGVAALRATQVGLGLMTLESVVSQVHGGNTLGPVFMLGLLLTVLGFLVLGVDGLRRPARRWLALLPLVAMLVGIGGGDHGGFVLLGVAWGALCVAAPSGLAVRESTLVG